jgi:NAD(P)H-dependent FMN reductase
MNLAVIIGSVREGRFGPVLGNWFTAQAASHGRFALDVIDLAQISLPAALPPNPTALMDVGARAPEQVSLAGRLAAADAFVVVTPEYNHSFPASLKHLIDWHLTEWQAKPVGFVSYGGLSGGSRAVEHLRQVFAELHAVTVRDSVQVNRFATDFGPDGSLPPDDYAHTAAKVLLDQLAWWASALHAAREASPYGSSLAS